MNDVEPNDAHKILAELQEYFDLEIITQNVDDMHERAGSKNVTYLHGEMKKARPVNSDQKIILWERDLNLGDLDDEGVQLRPHIVWFGEMVPKMNNAIAITEKADIFLVIGTSMQVYPAAGLIHYVPENCEVFVIDPNLENNFVKNENFLKTSATIGMRKLKMLLTKKE